MKRAAEATLPSSYTYGMVFITFLKSSINYSLRVSPPPLGAHLLLTIAVGMVIMQQ
jgi:hypothetical protein